MEEQAIRSVQTTWFIDTFPYPRANPAPTEEVEGATSFNDSLITSHNDVISLSLTEVTSSSKMSAVRTVVVATLLGVVMLSAVVGNVLVIISVLRYPRLRILANSFIVSLAFADLLVALLVMSFSASQVSK